MTQGSNELHFFYDAQNRPAVVVYNGTAYAYVKSLQGDIVAILDELALSQRFREETRRELGISDDKAHQWAIPDWAIGE